jgi:long-chain acyl-CoA synthetase
MEKVWLQHYLPGMAIEIDPDRFPSIAEVFDYAVKTFGDRPAYTCMGVSMTYNELSDKATRFAVYLQQLGLQKGDHIALQMPNLLQYPVCVFGAFRAGLVVVNVNPLYTPREMEHQLKDSEVKAIVIDSMFASKLDEIRAALPALKQIVVADFGCLFPALKRTVVGLVLKFIQKKVPAYALSGHVSLPQALRLGGRGQLKPVPIGGEQIAFIQYTGGTTGVSKGAMLTHRNLVANMEQACAYLGPSFTPGRELMITALPLYHIYALTVNCLMMTRLGGHQVLIPNPRDMKGFIKELSKHPFTVITAVNTLYNGLLSHPDFAKLDFGALKVASAGGMALQRAVAEKFQTVTGRKVCEGYGLTEASPITHSNPPWGDNRIGTIGLPLPSTDVRLVDDAGADVPAGERGEIWIKGPQVMLGYYNQPDETAKTLTPDGWLMTGDIGLMQPDGYFQIVDRKKEMIVVSGFKVFPNEVEDVLSQHPGIHEAAVIGVPDAHSGEAVKAFIVRKDPALTELTIRDYVHQNLTGYKRPKYIEFRDELPKSNVGKILRRPLREEELKKLGVTV